MLLLGSLTQETWIVIWLYMFPKSSLCYHLPYALKLSLVIWYPTVEFVLSQVLVFDHGLCKTPEFLLCNPISGTCIVYFENLIVSFHCSMEPRTRLCHFTLSEFLILLGAIYSTVAWHCMNTTTHHFSRFHYIYVTCGKKTCILFYLLHAWLFSYSLLLIHLLSMHVQVEELAFLIKDNLPCKHLLLSLEEALINFLEDDTR